MDELLPGGWFYPEDVEYYRNTIDTLPDKAQILEVGCWKGRSLCSVADIIKRKNIQVHVVDTFLGSENERETFHAEAKTLDIEKIFRENMERFGISENVTVLKEDSREVWKKNPIPDNYFDFIFIDGQHTADMVSNDIRSCLPKLKTGCLIAGHDLVLNEVKVGVESVFGKNYSVKTESKNIWEKQKMKEGKIVLISCWAKPLRDGKYNAKNPKEEWWLEIIKQLKEKEYTVWQCGQGPEKKLEGADLYLWDMDLWKLGEEILKCATWIAVDNFFPHWALLQFKKRGVVIWGQSDPEIFGHAENINMLKDKKYLRAKQFEVWEAATHNQEAFVSPEEVVREVEGLINNIGG